MSLGRIGTRAAVIGLGVLALMAAPSWAAKGGNSANADLCEKESSALVAQDGSHFKNAGQCTSYAAKGGRLAKLEVQINLESPHCFAPGVPGPCLGGTVSGFGLKPSSSVIEGLSVPGLYEEAIEEEVNEHGVLTPVTAVGATCPVSVSRASFSAIGTLASGIPSEAVVTGPTSC